MRLEKKSTVIHIMLITKFVRHITFEQYVWTSGNETIMFSSIFEYWVLLETCIW